MHCFSSEMIRAGQYCRCQRDLRFSPCMADALQRRGSTVRLRKRTASEEKPLALMFPSLEAIKLECRLMNLKRGFYFHQNLQLCCRKKHGKGNSNIASSIAPSNPYLGVMLPYTPCITFYSERTWFSGCRNTSGNCRTNRFVSMNTKPLESAQRNCRYISCS